MTEPPRSGHSTVGMLALGMVHVAGTGTEPLTLESLYEAHFEDVWRVLMRLGIRPPGIDDAVQDVFLIAHRRLPDFERRSSTKTWLIGIAMNVAKDHRRTYARKGDLDPLPEDLPDSGADSPLQAAEKAEAARFLDRFLESLDDEKREAFVLAELEGMTAPEIAELSGANVNTVYSRLRIAREKLERAIARRRAEEERSR